MDKNKIKEIVKKPLIMLITGLLAGTGGSEVADNFLNKPEESKVSFISRISENYKNCLVNGIENNENRNDVELKCSIEQLLEIEKRKIK